jgi:hypothetical protein
MILYLFLNVFERDGMPMGDTKIENNVQKHILRYLGSGSSLPMSACAQYTEKEHLDALIKCAMDHEYIQVTARRLRNNWELPLPPGWTVRYLPRKKDVDALKLELQSANTAILEEARSRGLFRRNVICSIDSSSGYMDAWLYPLDMGFRSSEIWKLFDDRSKRYLMPYLLDDMIKREIERTNCQCTS